MQLDKMSLLKTASGLVLQKELAIATTAVTKPIRRHHLKTFVATGRVARGYASNSSPLDNKTVPEQHPTHPVMQAIKVSFPGSIPMSLAPSTDRR
jgi:hypothetical protein